MNKVTLVGRLTKDPETRYSTGENAMAVTRFSVAVNRRFKNKDGIYEVDFPNCVCYGQTAEFVSKYFKMGMAIGLTGRIQTGSYTNKDGQKVYTTDVVVEETEFVERKNASNNSDNAPSSTVPSKATSDGFTNAPDEVDEEFPF